MHPIKSVRVGSQLHAGEWRDVFVAHYRDGDGFHYKFVADRPGVPAYFFSRADARAAAKKAFDKSAAA